MRNFILLSLSILINSTALPRAEALEPIPAPLNLGFYSTQSEAIPAAVHEQQKFIYRIEMPYFTQVVAKNYEALLNSEGISPAGKADIRACQSASKSSCIIHFAAIQGTAFLDQSGASVYTNCHIVHEWIAYRAQTLLLQGVAENKLLRPLLESSIPLTLTAANGTVLFSAESENPATLEHAVIFPENTAEIGCALSDDAVKIRLPRALAPKGLSIAPAGAAREGTLYVGGYPRSTTSRADFGREDSNGRDFYWTFGPALPAKGPAFTSYFGDASKYETAYAFIHATPILSDGIEGMSGGPVLNEKGELAGIFKGIMPMSEPYKDVPRASVFLDIDELLYIKSYSESMHERAYH